VGVCLFRVLCTVLYVQVMHDCFGVLGRCRCGCGCGEF